MGYARLAHAAGSAVSAIAAVAPANLRGTLGPYGGLFAAWAAMLLAKRSDGCLRAGLTFAVTLSKGTFFQCQALLSISG
jgi:hypothetical protein